MALIRFQLLYHDVYRCKWATIIQQAAAATCNHMQSERRTKITVIFVQVTFCCYFYSSIFIVVVVLKERRCSQYSSNKILDTKVTYEPLILDLNDQRVKRIYDPLVEQVGTPTFQFGRDEAGS